MARVVRGDTALFEVIMRRYNQRLYRLVRALLNDAYEAEDVVQETYVRAFEHLGQFAGRARFSTWLSHVAVNEARARIRQRRRAATQQADMSPIAVDHRRCATSPPPEERVSAAELRYLITTSLETLPRQMRAVFVLREVEGLGTQATAECLGLTPANVKVRLHRARQQLRGALEQALSTEARQLYTFDGQQCDRIVQHVFARIATSTGRASSLPER